MSGFSQKGAMGRYRQGTNLLTRDRVHMPVTMTAALLDISSQTQARLPGRASSSLGSTSGGKAFQSHKHFTQKPEQSPDSSATFHMVYDDSKGSGAVDLRGRAKCQNHPITQSSL